MPLEINPCADIEALIDYGLRTGLIGEPDRIFCRNRLLNLLGVPDWQPSAAPVSAPDGSPQPILDRLLDFAAESGALEANSIHFRDMLDTELMAVLTPRPSYVADKFAELLAVSPAAATDWFYAFSKSTNYIRTDRVAKDIKWIYPSPYGPLNITINLSKPEKQPTTADTAKQLDRPAYPPCPLCADNVGYAGSATAAPRANHRVIPITLSGSEWFIQYSPYVYYNEHCIAVNSRHRPMKIDRGSAERLLDFVRIFPHYFMGSNADLPIVGGSIVNHDHFQGGHFTFPMERAEISRRFAVLGYDDIECGVVKWPMSVIRLRGADPKRLADLFEHILSAWRAYSDPEVGVLAFTGATPHNTVTPIARRRGELYELDMTLRNNRTDAAHPLGIFHPHEERHHIKKENIGLIEVMGLAVLPPRLKTELAAIKGYLLGADRQAFYWDSSLESHADWYKSLEQRDDITPDTADDILRGEVGAIFTGVLEDAGVFKLDGPGQAAFKRFTDSL